MLQNIEKEGLTDILGCFPLRRDAINRVSTTRRRFFSSPLPKMFPRHVDSANMAG
jgi:hypothetical protein